jgi:hypothetical protein
MQPAALHSGGGGGGTKRGGNNLKTVHEREGNGSVMFGSSLAGLHVL